MFQIGDFDIGPLSWEKSFVGRTQESFIKKYYDTCIFFRADHSSGCLKNLVHSRVHIGIFVAHMIVSVEILPEDVMLKINSRDPGADTYYTDKRITLQIDTFGENASHNAECNERTGFGGFIFK